MPGNHYMWGMWAPSKEKAMLVSVSVSGNTGYKFTRRFVLNIILLDKEVFIILFFLIIVNAGFVPLVYQQKNNSIITELSIQ